MTGKNVDIAPLQPVVSPSPCSCHLGIDPRIALWVALVHVLEQRRAFLREQRAVVGSGERVQRVLDRQFQRRALCKFLAPVDRQKLLQKHNLRRLLRNNPKTD